MHGRLAVATDLNFDFDLLQHLRTSYDLTSERTSASASSRRAVLAVSEMKSEAEVETLTLVEADNKAGYFGVTHKPGRSNPTRRG